MLQQRFPAHRQKNFSVSSLFRLGACCWISSSSPKGNLPRVSALLSASMSSASNLPSQSFPYKPPAWATTNILSRPPTHGRLRLANLPTPLYRLNFLADKDESCSASVSLSKVVRDLDLNFYVKRDDSSGGVELGGNKIRKLEFLLADALAGGYDSVVTIGGLQSNHCRATAAACRMVGLEPHLILRCRRPAEQDEKKDADVGLVGNVLIDRMLGSSIYTCTPGEYGRIGSRQLVARLCAHLKDAHDKNVYPIPVGGSNGLGTWGYVEGVRELLEQWKSMADNNAESRPSLDHICFACGSGGTAAGIALGIALAFGALGDKKGTPPPQVHAIGVCDDPDYFYKHVAMIADEMGLKLPSSLGSTEAFIRQHMHVYQGKGRGYAASTPEELAFVRAFACQTGIVLDPVYSGKALYTFVQAMNDNPEDFRQSNVLFWHTGGALGLYDKSDDLLPSILGGHSPCQQLDLYGKGSGVDVSQAV